MVVKQAVRKALVHVSTGSKYLTVTPDAEGTYAVSVTVKAGGVSEGGGTNIVCTTPRPSDAPPPIDTPAFNAQSPGCQRRQRIAGRIRNFSPGQFSTSGTGLGWSLGSFGGYEVWDSADGLGAQTNFPMP